MSEARHLLPTHFILPDLFEDWPFNVDPNPHQQAVEDSDKWFGAFNLISSEARKGCKAGLLCSLFYPTATAAHLRIACDMMNLFYAFEVASDHKCSSEVRQQANTVMDALRNPDVVPATGEPALSAMARSFWKSHWPRSRQHSGSSIISMVTPRLLWKKLLIANEGLFALSKTICHVAVTPEYLDHLIVKKMELYVVDMVCIGNDVYSWNKEHRSGADSHNLVTLVMRDMHGSLQEAMDRVGDLYSDIRSKFMKEYTNLPSVDPDFDSFIKEYCWSLGVFVTGNHKWSHLSHRYFGRRGTEILESRRVELSPVQLHQTLLLEETA